MRMKTAAWLAMLLVQIPLSAHAATRVELGAASVVFPRGIPQKVVTTPEGRAQAEAKLRAISPAAADRMSKIDAETGPIEGWIVMDRPNGVTFSFSLFSERSMPPYLRQANQSKCPDRMPTCRDVRIGDAVGKEFDRLGPDGSKSTMLSVSKGGRRYLLSYVQAGRIALARLNATPGSDDPRTFLKSFRLDGATPVWQ
jgi:hypothetical protein